MKNKPDLKNQRFDPESFIQGAATSKADTPKRSRKPPASKARSAAKGHFRTTFDLPLDLYERLRQRAFTTRQPMRDLVVEALESHLGE